MKAGSVDTSQDWSRSRVMVLLFVIPTVVSAVATVPYAATQVSWTDSGELLASAYTLGIPHPTGYPLLSLISRAAISVLSWIDPIIVLNLMSAFFVSFASGVLSVVVAVLVWTTQHKKQSGLAITLAGCAGALFFTSSLTVWRQAVSYEVYSFQALVFSIAVLTFLLAVRDHRDDRQTISAWWILSGLVVGFGFSNHMMTVFLLPAFSWFAWKRWGQLSLRMVLAFTGSVGLSASTYVYLLLRSQSSPPLNWGDPSSLSAFVTHVSGKQYRVWMFSGLDVFTKSAQKFVAHFPGEFGWLPLLLCVVGLAWLWRRARDVFWFVGLLIGLTLIYSFNYDIHDIDTYFLLVHLTVSIVAGLGIFSLFGTVRGTPRWRRLVGLGGVVLILGGNALMKSGDYTPPDETSPEPFARSVLEGVERNASIITGQWDYLYSPILALQNIRGVRKDVKAIDIHLLRDRSWYVRDMIESYCIDDAAAVKSGKAFLAELTKFEGGIPFSAEVIQLRWQEFLRSLLELLRRHGPLYVDHEVIRELPSGLEYIPEGYLLRAYAIGQEPGYGGIPKYFPIQAENEDLAHDYRLFCSTVFINHGIRARSASDTVLLEQCHQIALSIEPSNPLLRVLQ